MQRFEQTRSKRLSDVGESTLTPKPCRCNREIVLKTVFSEYSTFVSVLDWRTQFIIAGQLGTT
jgi:hypothetical protein